MHAVKPSDAIQEAGKEVFPSSVPPPPRGCQRPSEAMSFSSSKNTYALFQHTETPNAARPGTPARAAFFFAMVSFVSSEQDHTLIKEKRNGTDHAGKGINGKRDHPKDDFRGHRREPLLSDAIVKNQPRRDS